MVNPTLRSPFPITCYSTGKAKEHSTPKWIISESKAPFPSKRPWIPDEMDPWGYIKSDEFKTLCKGLLNLSHTQYSWVRRVGLMCSRVWLRSDLNRKTKIKMLKQLRKHFVRVACHQKLVKIECSNWTRGFWQDSENMSLLSLKHIERETRNSNNFASALLSVLWTSRELVLRPEIDLKPILDPSSMTDDNYYQVTKDISANFNKLGISRDLLIDWQDSIDPYELWSGKRGPFGHATLHAYIDIYFTPQELWENLQLLTVTVLPIFCEWRNLENISSFRSDQLLTDYTKETSWFPPKAVRRLSAIADYEGKTRVIAIGDWLSQCILKPFHDRLMSKLKSISSDMTYRHEFVSRFVYQQYHKGTMPYSIDLTAATDRIPSSVTSYILGEIWGDQKVAQIWHQIMVGTGFVAPKDSNRTNNIVRYAIGQPMGLMSSWPAMALTNHVLVRLAAVRIGKNMFTDYLILGDDIVIFNEKVALEYISIMDRIGVSTNPDDSIRPERNKSLEISKRLFRNGQEISPLPLRLWKINRGLFFKHAMERGFTISLNRLHPEEIDACLSPLTAAVLLRYFQLLPKKPWWKDTERVASYCNRRDIEPKDFYGSFLYSLEPDLLKTLRSETFWGDLCEADLHHIYRMEILYNWWIRIESYKQFNAYDKFSDQTTLSGRRAFRKICSVCNSRWRTLIVKGPLKALATKWANSNLLRRAQLAVCRHHYVNNGWDIEWLQALPGHVATNINPDGSISDNVAANLYYGDDLLVGINDMKSWITISSRDLWINHLDKTDEQLIFGIQKSFEDFSISKYEMAFLIPWLSCQIAKIEKIDKDESVLSGETR